MSLLRRAERCAHNVECLRRVDLQRLRDMFQKVLLSNLEWVDYRVKCGRKPGEANA
jgi:hypothetical protein